MNLTLLKGYPDAIGKRKAWVGFGNGPKSYSQTTGDVLTIPIFQFYIDAVFGDVISVSKTYEVIPYPAGSGPRQVWTLKWFVVATGAEVANAVDLSAEVIQIGGFGGLY